MREPMYRAQLEAHPDAIELPTEQIALGHVRVAELDGVVIGFAALLERIGDACELDACSWSLIGCAAELVAGSSKRRYRWRAGRGATRIDVDANPQAVAFYEAAGFTTVGETQTRLGPAPRMSLSVAP